MTTNTTKKMTKAMWFEVLAQLVKDSNLSNKAEALEFIEHEVELLKKKAESKSTKTNSEHESVKNLIIEVLSETESENGLTVSEICKVLLETHNMIFTTQKIAAMVKKLVESGQVKRGESEKRKVALFSLVE